VKDIRRLRTTNVYNLGYKAGVCASCGLNMYKCARLMAEFKLCVLLCPTAPVSIFFPYRLLLLLLLISPALQPSAGCGLLVHEVS
jgi:hypothetical protein